MVGRDAGRLVVGTASAVLEGDLLGRYSRASARCARAAGADGYQQAQNAVARGAELIVGSYTPRYESASGNVLYNLAPTLQQVRLADGGEPLAANLTWIPRWPTNSGASSCSTANGCRVSSWGAARGRP